MQLGEDTTTMSMTLNPVNEAAFQKAVQSLETLNRAAVFHPTGTGKSCIAWKVVEAYPQTTFFWLVAGAQRLALRQAELTRYNGGTLPGNVRFCDCEKLAAATPEQWVRLGEQKPGCMVLDCYHELSAVCWAQSVQKLLRMCPQAKVLGLGVPNGAPVRAAAQELFADCIVSHMTVAEAMAAGTMPVPSAYAALLWPQEEELATLRARIKNLCMPKGDTSLRVQYEELSWSLRQVENLTVLLPRLLSDTSGHYLVLFESAAYQEKLGVELEQLLRTVDSAVRFYAADHACFADSAAVETFLSDTAPGPKVLLCVNAPGVQQPLEGLAGVILVRQSSLMSTFKQMLCRALVAAGSRSVPVFDLVAQFEGLGNGRTLQRDCTEAMTRAGSKTPGFRQERPMQQTYRLYGKLRREMEARWEVLCQAAADAAAKEGTTSAGMVVWGDGVWGEPTGIQDVVTYSVSVRDPVTAYLKIKTADIPGRITVKKVDAEGDPLSGIRFLLESSADQVNWQEVNGYGWLGLLGKPDSRRQHLLPGDRGADGGGNDAADGAAVRGNAGRRQP